MCERERRRGRERKKERDRVCETTTCEKNKKTKGKTRQKDETKEDIDHGCVVTVCTIGTYPMQINDRRQRGEKETDWNE